VRRAEALAVVVAVAAILVAGYLAADRGGVAPATATVTVTAITTSTVTTTMIETETATVTTTVPEAVTTTVVETHTRVEKRVVLVDALGRTVELEKPAERVVALAPSITEDVCSLGLCSRLVGVDSFSKSLPGVPSDAADVGGYWQPSSESIAGLKPDLVLACSGVPAQEQMTRQLEGLGVKVFFLRCDRARSLDDIYWDLRAVAALLGEPQAADHVIESMRERVASLEERLANTTRPSVALLVYLQENGAWVAGGGTFQDTVIDLAGGSNVFHSLYGWQMVGYEELVSRDPDYILVTGMTRADFNRTIELMEKTPLHETKAFREGHVCVLYGAATDALNRPSPGIVDAAYLLASILHPGVVEPPERLAGNYTCLGQG